MDNHITVNLDLLKFFLDGAAKRLVGKCMKQFEILADKEIIKKEVKELIYQEMRGITDTLETGKILFTIENKSKEQK